ncbi:MAG: hypothetical protein PHN33_04345 [Candidatus Peribacteraceae bacterium]|nr:hypothetical protein [Candidatus Peribacteraceae bacterium]
MSIAVLSHPPGVSESCAPPEENIPPDQLGKYSVRHQNFIRCAAHDLMERCERHHVALPDSVVSALQLAEGARDEDGMFRALLHIEDLAERRRAVCQMVHAIVRLK